MSAIDTDRGVGHACHAVPVLGHFIGCLFFGGLLWSLFPSLHILLPCHTSFLNVYQVPVFFSALLHPQRLHVSQCPSNGAKLLCPPEQTHWAHAGGTLTSSAVTVSLSVQDQHGKQKALGSGSGKGFHLNPGPATGGWGHLGVSFIVGPPRLNQRKLPLPTAPLPQSRGQTQGRGLPQPQTSPGTGPPGLQAVLLHLFLKIN